LAPTPSLVALGFEQAIRGVGIGFAFMPAFIAAFAALERHELPDAAPQLTVLMRVGGSIGTAVLAVVLQRTLASAHHPLTLAAAAGAYGTAFWWGVAIIVAAIVPCIILLRAESKARGVARARADADRDAGSGPARAGRGGSVIAAPTTEGEPATDRDAALEHFGLAFQARDGSRAPAPRPRYAPRRRAQLRAVWLDVRTRRGR